jgi:hypothetical protein
MEDKTLFDTQTKIAIIVVVFAFTGGNLWINRGGPPLGYERYSRDDFRIDYRKDMYLEEQSLGGDIVSDSFGIVMGRLEDESLEQFGVIWITPEMEDTTPEDSLDNLFKMVEMDGTQIVGKGEKLTDSKDGHRLVYQTFIILDSGINIQGIIGSWYCEDAGKFLMLYLIHVPDLSQPEIPSQDIEERWRAYLDNLVCI